MSVLCIHLLGSLTLTWDDVPLPSISGVTARSLFAYLVTYRDRPHTRDLLAGSFWPDQPDATARRRLSRALWEIRRILRQVQDKALSPHPVLLIAGDTVQLNPDLPLWLDVAAFEELVDWSHLPTLSKTVELYRGDFLAGYYDDWLLVERERLREVFLAALARLAEGYKGRGEYERALTYARRLAMEDPWREEVHREVMRICHLLGRGNEALKQFETCRQILAEELDVEPSPETATLIREIAERDAQVPVPDLPEASPPPSAIVLDGAQVVELPLVGREQERAELLTHVQALLQGLGGIVLVEGEAGVGKTRLLQTVARDAEWRGAEVLWGERQEIAPAIPYGPLVEALADGLSPLRASQLAQLVERIWLQVLAILLPSLAAWLPDLTPPPQLDPSQERDRLVMALAHLLTGWSRIKPLLVVLENLHWMGEDTLDMLARLAPLLSERGVLLIGSYRGEDARALPGIWKKLEALDRVGVQHRLSLSGLGDAATGELIRRSLGMGNPVPLFETRLYRETKGNPLFVLETLRALYGEGLLVRDADGHWSTPWDKTTDDYAELPLPRAVEQTIARRLDFLSPALRETIHLAAVLGERFDFDLLHAASPGESPSVLAALRELVQRRFLDETARDYRFSHDKVRQVTYDGIAAPERSLLHRQVACALEAIQPERAAVLAHHWTQAGVWEKAADYHQQAGDRAQAVYANAEATAHYTQALEALERLPGPTDPPRSFELLLAREAVYGLQGERAAQAEDLRAQEDLAEQLDDNQRRAEVALRQANYAWLTGDYSAAIAAARAAIGLAQDEGKQAESYLVWGRVLVRQGEYERARTQLAQALALARERGFRQVEADSRRSLGIASWYQGDYAEARAYYEQCLHIFHEIGDRRGESAVFNNLGMVSWTQDDNAGAKAYYEQSLRIKREIGDRKGEGAVLNNLGNIHWSQSDYAGARAYYEQSLHIKHEIGDRQGEGLTLLNLGLVSNEQGDYAGARAYNEQALRICCEIGDRQNEGLTLLHQGLVLNHLGDYAGARVCYEQALHICHEIGDRRNKSLTLSHLGLLFHHLGDDETARGYSQQAQLIAQEIGDHLAHGQALHSLGHALAGLGRLAEAADVYQSALDIRREMGEHNPALESLADLARVSLVQGKLSQAQEYVGEILSHLETNPTLDGTDEPFRIHLICYRVLRVHHAPRAEAVLVTAHRLLQERADGIEEEQLRCSFLENVSAHREIIAAYRELQAPQPGRQIQVHLPRADAPLGRPLRDDEYTTVTWTVDAPEDATVRGKVARRHHRILRLLTEAQTQAAAPTHTHLADALGVSRRTIERDVAALRREHSDVPPTRGKMSE